MIRKILFLISILFSGFMIIISQAKFVKQNEMTIAKVNVDTIIPEIKIISIQNIMYKENEINYYDVIVNLKVIESNIKENNIRDIKILIDEINFKNFEIIETKTQTCEMYYEIKINKLSKNQKIKIVIPEGTVVDNANNRNEYKTIEHEIL